MEAVQAWTGDGQREVGGMPSSARAALSRPPSTLSATCCEGTLRQLRCAAAEAALGRTRCFEQGPGARSFHRGGRLAPVRNITAEWGRAAKDWKEAMNQFAILYEDRFTTAPD
jgi:hypothetical protein